MQSEPHTPNPRPCPPSLDIPITVIVTKRLPYLVVEEKESTEQAVQICCEQRKVDGGGARFLYDNWHKAVETKHAGTKANIEKSWGAKRRQCQGLCRAPSASEVGE